MRLTSFDNKSTLMRVSLLSFFFLTKSYIFQCTDRDSVPMKKKYTCETNLYEETINSRGILIEIIYQ